MMAMPVWRSLLYVPVNVEKYVEKAHTRGADCIQLDLEDSVPGRRRRTPGRWSRMLRSGAPWRRRRGGAHQQPLESALLDLESCICGDVDAIAVTKTENASYVQRIDEAISRLEGTRGLPERRTRLIAMVETPARVLRDALDRARERDAWWR
jgi:citrate lyase subunit beta/citryl-CoA lyase